MIKFKKLAVCVLGVAMVASTISGVSISLGGVEVKAVAPTYTYVGYKQFTDSSNIQRHYQEYTDGSSTYAYLSQYDDYLDVDDIQYYSSSYFTACANGGDGKCIICGGATTNDVVSEGTLYYNMKEITSVSQLKDDTRYLFLNEEYSSNEAVIDLPDGAGLIETVSLVGSDGSVTLTDTEKSSYYMTTFTDNKIDEKYYDGKVTDTSSEEGTPYVGDLDVAAFVKTIIRGKGFDGCEYGAITLQSGYPLSHSADRESTNKYIYSSSESEAGSGWLYGCYYDFFVDYMLTPYSKLYTYSTKTYTKDDIYVVLKDGKTIPDEETTITTDDLTVVIVIDGTTYDVPFFTILDNNNTVSKDDHEITVSVGGVIKNVTIQKRSEVGHTHSYVNHAKVDATCTTAGTKEYWTCSGCDKIFDADKNEITDKSTLVIAAKGHDFSGEWKVIKEATATTDGKKETVCKNGCGLKKVVTIPATESKEEDPSNGKLEADAEVAKDVPVDSVSLDNSKTSLLEAKGIFTSDEASAIKNGQSAKVYLTVSNLKNTDISTEDVNKIETKAKESLGGKLTIKYLDVSLFKKVGDNEAVKISNPGTDIEVTFTMPDELCLDSTTMERVYKIIRLHEGTATTISGTFNKETKEFSFKTDAFSTYAIAYDDVAVTADNTDTEEDVKTGYADYTWMWAAFIVACAGIAAFTYNKKRQTN